MKKSIHLTILFALLLTLISTTVWARGTRYIIDWPKAHIGPVYVQLYDIRCNAPYQELEEFKVWVTWNGQTKLYKIGNIGTYTLKLYKHDYLYGPMVISGMASSFKIRYSLVPPWI